MRSYIGLWLIVLAGVSMLFPGCATKQDYYKSMMERQRSIDAMRDSSLRELPHMNNKDHERVGDLYFRQGKLELAYVEYSKALQAKPESAVLRYKIGLIFLSQRLHRDALNQFREVITKQPQNAMAFEGEGEALFRLGQYDKAQESFEKALQLNPKLWRSHNFLGVLYDYKHQPAMAIEEYREAIANRPNDAYLYNNLGVAYSLSGRLDEALAAFRSALSYARTDPETKRIYNNLGLVLCRQGKYAEALQEFRMAEDEAEAYNNLGYFCFSQGNYEKAIAAFQKAIDLKQNFYSKANENLQMAQTALQSMQSPDSRPTDLHASSIIDTSLGTPVPESGLPPVQRK